MQKVISTLLFSGKFTFLLFSCFAAINTSAQDYDCSFKEPLIKIDFGTNQEPRDANLSALKNYGKVNDPCPQDGFYSFTSYTDNCFNGNWYALPQDHTPGDVNGRMLVVNASNTPGTFFLNYITGLTPGAKYEISTWLTNICYGANGCFPIPPSISISILADGTLLSRFETGDIPAPDAPNWQRYYGIFTMPPDKSTILIKMDDVNPGGCGNDFAIDDIMLRECKIKIPPVVTPPKPEPMVIAVPEKKKNIKEIPPQKNVIKETVPVETPLKKNTPVITKAPVDKNPAIITDRVIEKQLNIPVPDPILKRANPVIKRIETEEAELLINLYDNGEIDGDTVSIYHNNQLIKDHAGLSEKPITVKIKVDKQHPHHELVMVAENLGSIPPNTSLMVVTVNNKRYEIFISSSEEKNAKIVIDLKED